MNETQFEKNRTKHSGFGNSVNLLAFMAHRITDSICPPVLLVILIPALRSSKTLLIKYFPYNQSTKTKTIRRRETYRTAKMFEKS